MTTECTTERLEFGGLRRQRVVGRFDGGELGSDGGGLLLRELAQRTGLFGRLSACFRDYREPQRTRHPVEVLVAARVLGLAQGKLAGAAAGQEHAEPDGANGAGAGGRGALQEDRGGHRAAGCPAGGPVPGLARVAARAHRAGRGRDGRSAARPPGGPLLPWLLPQLLLLAAVHFLWPAAAGGTLADGGPGRGGGHGGGAGADRGEDPAALARGGDLAARGQRVLPRGIDGLVRGAGGGVCAGDRAEPALEAALGRGAGAGPPGVRALYEEVYCARGDMENRIKEQQLALFADRTSARSQCDTIRLKLLKIGVRIRVSVRAVRLSFDEGFPEAGLFGQVLARLQSLPLRS